MIEVVGIAADRPCPEYCCFVNVDGDVLFLCAHATGATIAAEPHSSVVAGELRGERRRLTYTGNPWDDVVIAGSSTHMILTGVCERIAESTSH